MGCKHNWVLGPFFITVAITYEEPTYYPPGGGLRVEHCTKCGLIRIPEVTREADGMYMMQKGRE